MPYLLLALLAYPAAEIVVMVLTAKAIGTGWVLGWIVLTALAGVLMLRHHRLAVGWSLVSDLRAGKLSVRSLFWVARYYIAALLLLLPGLIGDLAGLLLLLPWGRSPDAPAIDGAIDGEYRRIEQPVEPGQRLKR
ncbi:FxsA family protein [Chitiniphilus purpureus]|uniref:FxsA family protein n=1 Tax=Chitiniphilus purpureus TaxID=2981137 RepID=A0ABY6DS33_9NEIS|nr:FxsA family protein [Chitiniphilus sp. CD1]UXY14713.1 FxsA family protein [Chitiniphilus sp. CD1]